MKILGIETSCDETSAAVVLNGSKILSNIVTSSVQIHQKTGGIIPEMAAREQIKCIISVIKNALNEAKTSLDDIDAIAVTVGPGLIGSLLVGVETAKTISFVKKKPIVPINHIFAHFYANWLGKKKPEFPIIALVVSGGHTELFLVKNHGKLKWIGGTLDDAAGEAFDKTARLLGLGYPGGPAIAAEAAKFEIRNSKYQVRLPRPMIGSDDLNFSFSGLKTAVLREVNKLKKDKKWNKSVATYLSYEIQESITDVLVRKTLKAAEKYKVKSLLLGGGVAANRRLNIKLKSEIRSTKSETKLYIPDPKLCTDNAAYIASYAYFNYKPVGWQDIEAKPNMEVEV